jgi:squalene/oxidosqualene cyclase-like protein
MNPPEVSVREAIRKSLRNLAGLQSESGAWEGEVAWSPVLLSQYLIVRSIIGRSAPEPLRGNSILYFTQWQLEDGGWGFHPESASSLFVTTLAYVALRSIGVAADDSRCCRARALIRKLGTPLSAPTWGKLWLCFFNIYKYEGVHPLPPELWLLPRWFPFHPSRLYCHTRLIYLAMSFLYGKRFCRPADPLCHSLREELYEKPYDSIDFRSAKSRCAKTDLFVAPSWILSAVNTFLGIVEKCCPPLVRCRGLETTLKRIEYEQRSTSFAALSPVNGMLNILALFAVDPGHADLGKSLDGLEHWLWRDDAFGGGGGVRMAGARSQTWDTAFVVQAAIAAGADAFAPSLDRAAFFLAANQMSSELDNGAAFDRDPRLGGWCFSDARHGWPVSDTTAEALCAAFALRQRGIEMLGVSAMESGIRFLLLRQNQDGGWGSYEKRRGAMLLEKLNPSEMFGSCMVEHSYVECTASALDALARFRKTHPTGHLSTNCADAIKRGTRFILKSQRPDGAWPGFWGINYTYGTFFAVRGLLACGIPEKSRAVRRACDWLVTHQKSDGGWGEHWTGMTQNRYVEHPASQVIMTAWALLTLLLAKDDRCSAIERGVELLISRQAQDGSWPREAVAGVFFQTAMLHYDLYRDYFSLWALGLFTQRHS